jgi:hypothetical protein
MNELNKDQWLKSMSTGVGDPDHPINGDVKDEVGKLKVQVENAEMAMSDVTKLIKYSEALQKMFNPSEDLEDWVEAKLNHACDYVATVRDYLKFYRDEKEAGTPEDQINEKWSKKQKQGINCSNPKGFSQRAHCAGRRARQAGKRTKSSSVSEVELYNDVLKDLVEALIEDIGNSYMAMGALKQLNNDAKELQSMLKPETQLEDWVKAKLNLAGEYLDDVYHHLDHFGSDGRKFDENINEEDYQGMVGFHELMMFYGKASDTQRQQMDDCLANKNVECVKDLVHQVTGMTMANLSESDLPSFYKEKDRRLRLAVRPVISQIAYWVSPTGELIRVGDHSKWVRDNRDKIEGFDSSEPYLSAFKNGYIRLVYLPQYHSVELNNYANEDDTERFYVTGYERSGIPPVTSDAKDAIRQFIKEKNILLVSDGRGKLRIDEIMNESWGAKTLSTAALAAAMALGTPNAQAANAKGKQPVAVKTVVKPSTSKVNTIAIFNKYTSIHPDYPKFLNALHQVESGGRITGDKPIMGDNGKARGPFQIHREYWEDVKNVVGGKYEDVDDLDYATKVVTAYMLKYAKNAIKNGQFDIVAKRHNGGPIGDKKSATLTYATKVMSKMPSEYVMAKKENVNGSTTV